MKKWLLLITFMALYMGFETVRADERKTCAQGFSTFGKLTCGSNSKVEVDAYFLGASSLEEVRKNYAERFEKIRQKCDQKVMARRLAAVPKGAAIERDALQFRVQTVTACIRKRGHQEPCVRNTDCLENVCNPERGTCSSISTIPMSAAQ